MPTVNPITKNGAPYVTPTERAAAFLVARGLAYVANNVHIQRDGRDVAHVDLVMLDGTTTVLVWIQVMQELDGEAPERVAATYGHDLMEIATTLYCEDHQETAEIRAELVTITQRISHNVTSQVYIARDIPA